ncbi:MAG: MATE family efflux transporter [Phycisphaerae bacterium]|nr:MATE family efflux transporter [Phycisphaerae bacterium]MCZ2398529.1 MATE family efflux transporter [Phycisphaerae bacterium]
MSETSHHPGDAAGLRARFGALIARSDTLALLWLALPMIGMTLSRMLMGFIDFYMVSQLGTDAQAAIYPSALLLFTIGCVGMGLTQGVQTFVSQAEGRGEPQRAGAYVWQALYIALIAAAVSAPIALLVPRWFPFLAVLGGHPPAVESLEIAFLSVTFWAIGPMTACAGLESFYNGVRRPIIGFAAMGVSLVGNVIGNYALIFGHWGMPALGIAGAGIATLAAWCLRLMVLLTPLMWRGLVERYRLNDWRPKAARLGEVVHLGGPVAFQWLVDIGAWFVFTQLMIPPFGSVEMAAAGLAIQYMHLSFMPALGVGLALTTQVGNAIGAGSPETAARKVRAARRLICGYMSAMGLVFVTCGGWLAERLCFEQEAEVRAAVIASATLMLVWVAVFQFSDAVCVVYSFAARGAGDTRVPALLFALCCWGIFVPFGLLLSRGAPQLGAHGPWSMCTLYILVLGVLLWRRFHSGAWRQIRIFADAPPAETAATAQQAAPAPAAALGAEADAGEPVSPG